MVRNRFRPELRVGGYRLSAIVRWDDLKHSGDLNGDVDLSARIIFKGDWRHRALRDKAPVELMRGPACLWAGTLVEPDWDAGTIAAIGASRDADNALALDAAGNASTKPNEVIDAAIARGALSWTRVADFGNTPVGDPDAGGISTVRSVLDAWVALGNPIWHVDSRRRLITDDAEETKIRWLITPGSGVLGASGTERVDVVVVRYVNKTTGRRDTVRYPTVSPTRPTESPKDITDRGPLTPTEASTIAAGLWAEHNSGRAGWTNGLRLAGRQVTNLGGTVADLTFVRAPKAMALRSVPDPRGVSRNTSVVIGDYEVDWATGELQVNPRGLAAQDEQSALDSVADLATTALARAGGTIADTDWISVPSVLAGVLVHYRVLDRECTVRLTGSGTLANNAITDVAAAGALPAAVRPSTNAWGLAFVTGTAWGAMTVDSTGGVRAIQREGASRTGNFNAFRTYPIG